MSTQTAAQIDELPYYLEPGDVECPACARLREQA